MGLPFALTGTTHSRPSGRGIRGNPALGLWLSLCDDLPAGSMERWLLLDCRCIGSNLALGPGLVFLAARLHPVELVLHFALCLLCCVSYRLLHAAGLHIDVTQFQVRSANLLTCAASIVLCWSQNAALRKPTRLD